MDRRRFVVRLGALSSTAVAGCLRLSSGGGNESDGGGNSSGTNGSSGNGSSGNGSSGNGSTDGGNTTNPTGTTTGGGGTTTESGGTTDAGTPTAEGPPPRSGWRVGAVTVGKAPINAVEFVDEAVGWMAVGAGQSETSDNGGFYRTDDGGNSWTRMKSYNAIEVTLAGDGGRVYGFGEPEGTGKYVWYSDDGGENWSSRDVRRGVQDVVFFDREVGVAVDETGRDLFRTTDGARSFEKQEPAGCRPVALGSRGDHVWAVGEDDRGPCLLHSDSRGESGTWSARRFSNDVGDGGQLQDVYAPSPEEVWVVGQGRQIHHTTDGGTEWTQVEGVPEDVEEFVGIDGLDGHLVAAGNAGDGSGVVYESIDGGASWGITWSGSQRGKSLLGVEYAPDQNQVYAYGEDALYVGFTGRE